MNGKVTINGSLVVLRRTELGLTQSELAERVGCCHRTVQRAENGCQVLLRTARELAQGIGVELPAIMLMEQLSEDLRPRADHGTREDRVVAAFKAADDAIQDTLGRAGGYGMNELTEVLSLLATRYGCASLKAVQIAFEQGMIAIPDVAAVEERIRLRGGAPTS